MPAEKRLSHLSARHRRAQIAAHTPFIVKQLLLVVRNHCSKQSYCSKTTTAASKARNTCVALDTDHYSLGTAPCRQPRSLGQTDIKPVPLASDAAGRQPLLYDYSPARDAALLEAWSSVAAGVSYFDSGDRTARRARRQRQTLLGRFAATTSKCASTRSSRRPLAAES